MDPGRETLSKRDFAETAKSFGYKYTAFSPAASLACDRAPLFEGTVGIQSFPSGLSVCASDLTALHESEHDGFVPRSVTVALMLEGMSGEPGFGVRGTLQVGPGRAALVSTVDETRLAGTIGAGQRSRCLLVRAQPDDLADEDLADRVDASLRSTSVQPFPLSARTQTLANELFAPGLDGGAGRLLSESCALELLARSPLFDKHGHDGSAGPVSRRDQARMAVVRDALMAEPDREHHLCDLARLAGVSVTALKTKFVAVFGQPVFAFLRDVRLERARRGLEQHDWTVAQAAYYTGYRHPTSFNFAFRRKYGIAPSAVRRR